MKNFLSRDEAKPEGQDQKRHVRVLDFLLERRLAEMVETSPNDSGDITVTLDKHDDVTGRSEEVPAEIRLEIQEPEEEDTVIEGDLEYGTDEFDMYDLQSAEGELGNSKLDLDSFGVYTESADANHKVTKDIKGHVTKDRKHKRRSRRSVTRWNKGVYIHNLPSKVSDRWQQQPQVQDRWQQQPQVQDRWQQPEVSDQWQDKDEWRPQTDVSSTVNEWRPREVNSVVNEVQLYPEYVPTVDKGVGHMIYSTVPPPPPPPTSRYPHNPWSPPLHPPARPHHHYHTAPQGKAAPQHPYQLHEPIPHHNRLDNHLQARDNHVNNHHLHEPIHNHLSNHGNQHQVHGNHGNHNQQHSHHDIYQDSLDNNGNHGNNGHVHSHHHGDGVYHSHLHEHPHHLHGCNMLLISNIFHEEESALLTPTQRL